MRLRVLGAAAGGGFPQWNCGCPCCRAVRDGSSPCVARTQSSVAVSADESQWFLLNASPDVRGQIESFPALRPREGRDTPLRGVLLTDAELDHTLGLLLLRESPSLRLYATGTACQTLRDGSALLPTLGTYCPVEWEPVVPGTRVALGGGLSYRAFDVPTAKRARFATDHGPGRVVGYRLTDDRSGTCVVYLPGLQNMTPEILRELDGCDCVLVDGTCWSDDELARLGCGSATAREMGHLPIAGRGGSLERLAPLPIPRKVYVHLNNTNPVLLDDSKQRRRVEEAGIEVAHDGMEVLI